MSQYGSGKRDRSSRREEIYRRDGTSARDILIISENPRSHQHPPELPVPPAIHISSLDEPYIIPGPPSPPPPPPPPRRPTYSWERTRPPRRKTGNRRYYTHDVKRGDDPVEGDESDDRGDQMPDVRQTYQPHSARHHRSASSFHPVYAAEVHTASALPTHQPPSTHGSSSGGGGGGGKILLAAARKAVGDPRTLNSILICVYRSSRRDFESRRIRLVRKEFKRESGQLHHSQLLTDAAFF